jgi:hypothetical protein
LQTAIPAAGDDSQIIEGMTKKTGLNLGIATFLPARVRLSIRIYKICTLLSTGFVDNPLPTLEATRPKALSGAGSGAAADPYWEYALCRVPPAG